MLTLLDLSAAFHSVDHDTLLRRLQTSYDLNGVIINWFISYLSSWLQHVRVVHRHRWCFTVYHIGRSSDRFYFCSIPPICCSWSNVIGFISMLSQMILRSTGSVNHQLFTAFARGCPPVLMKCSREWQLTSCCSTLRRPKCSGPRRQHFIPTGAVRINNTFVLPVHSVRDLGVYIDADTAMKNHATATIKDCFTALK